MTSTDKTLDGVAKIDMASKKDEPSGEVELARVVNQDDVSTEESPSGQTHTVALQRREIARLSNRLTDAKIKLNSVRYKVGSLVVEALRHPARKGWRLPWDLIVLWRNCPASGSVEANYSPRTAPYQQRHALRSDDPQNIDLFAAKPEDTLLFLPINGTGLGHLTRCLALANQIRSIAPEKQIFFLTTSVAIPILFQQEYPAYHIPPQDAVEHLLSGSQWEEIFENTLNDIIRLHRPGTIVFDGTSPYEGVRRSLKAHKGIKTVWVKRGLYRTAAISALVKDYVEMFDRIIVPGELQTGKNYSKRGKTESVAPIVYQSGERRMDKANASRVLNLDESKPIAYIQLGAGNINDIQGQTQVIINLLNVRFPEMQLVVGESPISRSRASLQGTYSVLRDFPNSNYFDAFDLAVLAAGYNSVYETVFFDLPTIFLPRTVGTDNQVARAKLAEDFGTARVMEKFDPEEFCSVVANFLRRPRRAESNGTFPNGVRSAAQYILETATAEKPYPIPVHSG